MKKSKLQLLASSSDTQTRMLATELLQKTIEVEELRKDTDEFYTEVEKIIADIDSTRNKFFLFRMAAWVRAAERMLTFLAEKVEKYKKKES